MEGRYFCIVSEVNNLVLEFPVSPGQTYVPHTTPVYTWTPKIETHQGRAWMTHDDGQDNQLWYQDPFTRTIRSKVNGYCLDVHNSNLVKQVMVNGHSYKRKDQQWRITLYDQNRVRIENYLDSSLVLTLSQNSMGASVLVSEWEDKATQRWRIDTKPPELFYIVSEMHDKVLDVRSSNVGAQVTVCARQSTVHDNQLWYEDENGTLRSKLTQFSLQAETNNSFTCRPFDKNNALQKWHIDGNVIRNRYNANYVVDVNSTGHVISYEFHGGSNQLWQRQYPYHGYYPFISFGPYPVTEGGNAFTDLALSNDNITEILVQHTSECIHYIKVRYGSQWSDKHGRSGSGGKDSHIELEAGEVITTVCGNNNAFNTNRITFKSNRNRVFGPYGSTRVLENYEVDAGTQLAYLSGRSGKRIDQLFFHFKDHPFISFGPYPVTGGGNPFSDLALSNNRITELLVQHNFKCIHYLRVCYGSKWSEIHGRESTSSDKIVRKEIDTTLQEGEFITRVSGNNDDFMQNRITFKTNLGRVFGPYGSNSVLETYNVCPGTELAYLSGRCGKYLDQVFFHFKGKDVKE